MILALGISRFSRDAESRSTQHQAHLNFTGAHMHTHLKAPGLLLAAAPMVTACATKGFVREQVATERQARELAINEERTARIAGDSVLRQDLESMRRDLATLRTEFGAKITALEEGMQFAFPVN